MNFNSIIFVLLFFPLVSIGYYLTPHRFRWALLLAASCWFYMSFVPAYILILGFVIVIDYCAGIWIARSTGRRRKLFLTASIVANVSVLCVFKYYGFLNDNIAAIAQFIGWNYSSTALNIVLPIGLSFHTFQSMSYTIEVYRGKQQPERRFEILALYVLFYPQLVAGPIERPQSLLRQLREHHHFDYDQITGGLKLMAWGFFQKMVIADAIATITGPVFAAPESYHGLSLIVVTALFSVQVFCDFAGYSDIALGCAQVIGFRLATNFRQPFLATSVASFWSRWHISLSTWFRDYLYIPACRKWTRPIQRHIALTGVFALIGLWHGASWTFIIWGVLNAGMMILSTTTKSIRKTIATRTGIVQHPRLHTLVQIALAFVAINIPGVFFPATTTGNALYMLANMVPRNPLAELMALGSLPQLLTLAVLLIILMAVQIGREGRGLRNLISMQPVWVRWPIYSTGLAVVLLFKQSTSPEFVYFQF